LLRSRHKQLQKRLEVNLEPSPILRDTAEVYFFGTRTS